MYPISCLCMQNLTLKTCFLAASDLYSHIDCMHTNVLVVLCCHCRNSVVRLTNCFCYHFVDDGVSINEGHSLAVDALPILQPSAIQLKQGFIPAIRSPDVVEISLEKTKPQHTKPQHTPPSDVTLPLPNGGMLTVKKGDILKEKVTAIINAANEKLDHIGGVAFAIDRASRGNVQRESRKVIQSRGRVPTGQVAVTGAGGSLQCLRVIHAVGPDAHERPHKECEQLLVLVCENVLRTAEAQGMVSVALPAISSGIYAMKKDVVAQILINTILYYRYHHTSTLKDIRIVLFEEETLRLFLQFACEAKKGVPPGAMQPVVTPPRSPDIVEIPLEKTKPQHTPPNDITLPLPNGGTLTVKKGDILKEKVTAIINAANEKLDHIGGVAFAIDRASRGNVQRESRKVIQSRGHVPTGQVAVTGAGGSLQCQRVIHAVGPDAHERPHKECEQLLVLVCENVLRTAEAQGMVSVALPAISSGIYAMKKDVVAQILINTILYYRYHHTSTLKDIRIVLFEEETLRLFLQFACEAKKGVPPGAMQPVVTPPRSPDIVEIPLEKTKPQHTPPNDITLPLPNGGTLTVKKGDILKEKVTAIINAANEKLDHIGGVAFAIDRASRGNVQRESKKVIQSRGHVPTGQVAVTGAGGSLQCQRVIHAVGPDANFRPHKECEQLLALVCENVLRTAEAQGMVSVALPAISSGIYAMKKDVVAQILISTILHYPYQHTSTLKDIRIVLFEEETLRPFLQFASEAKKGMPPGVMQPVVTPPRSPDVVEIPLKKTHRKMVVKKAHFIYEDADIKVAAICSDLGFQTGCNKELDGHLKGQLSEVVKGRYRLYRPDKFDVLTVHVQHAAIGCRFLVIANILDRSLGTRQDGHKYLQQILRAVCQESDTLEMPSVAIAPYSFSIGGFQKGTILPEFIKVISHFTFTNDDSFTDMRFLATQDGFDRLVADAERTVGKTLRRSPQPAEVANQSTLDCP